MNTVIRRNTDSSHIIFPRHALEIEKPPPLIKPSYSSHGISNLESDPFIIFIEQILRDSSLRISSSPYRLQKILS